MFGVQFPINYIFVTKYFLETLLLLKPARVVGWYVHALTTYLFDGGIWRGALWNDLDKAASSCKHEAAVYANVWVNITRKQPPFVGKIYKYL